MSVRYQFKNTIKYDTITFPGNSISLGDFKEQVIKKIHLTTNDDLRVVVAETKHEYTKLDDQIPKNTSVIISRVPRTPQSKKTNATKGVLTSKTNCINLEKPKIDDGIAKTIIDLSKLNISEEKKIEVMMKQSTSVYSPSKYSRIASKVPKNYRCNKCHLLGHWIKDCPVVVPKIPMPPRGKAGIPKSFLNAESQQNKENTFPVRQHVDRNWSEAPSDLLCPICYEVFVDAVMISCCGGTFCDNCIRIKIIESTNNECPECLEGDIDLESLIPNRYIRMAVSKFKCERTHVQMSCKTKK